MWSLGCVGAELFLGLPLFPGASEFNLVQRIVETLGMPPQSLLSKAANTHKYFKRSAAPADGADGTEGAFVLRSEEEVRWIPFPLPSVGLLPSHPLPSCPSLIDAARSPLPLAFDFLPLIEHS